ncbi:glycoside hydrolase family 16 protein [Haloferula sp. BvORR071]|uniref:glycoside hydrolase family 16 protein n=1 Tax=Haloferula sp. BvORR071 TaxID=1396141 RepID=UPI000555317B|nr:glycoside hydrolase family 16 protein [Haloferula sp. BvORR071]
MSRPFFLRALALCCLSLAAADAAPAEPLLGSAAAKSESAQVSFETSDKGLAIKILPGGDGYPGLSLVPANGKVFDLSAHGHVDATFTNTGKVPVDIALRVDNAGDWQNEPWNTENLSVAPGQQATLHLVFGHSYGRKKGYALNPKEVVRLLIFTGKTEQEKAFRIDSIIAGGERGEKPEESPEQVRLLPEKGAIFPAPLHIEGRDGGNGAMDSITSVRASFPNAESQVALRPEEGRWDLSQCMQVVVTLRNEGGKPVRPRLGLESNGGPTDTVQGEELAARKSKEYAVSFIPKKPWLGRPDYAGKGETAVEGRGSRFTSDAVAAVVISAGVADAKLAITSITADAPAAKLPEWLGKRPPVEGEWVQTFAEEFDGNAVNEKQWNVHAANYWDKVSWFSRDNVIVGGGAAKLRYEKRTGHHNDDPKEKEFHYATGFLDTFGKWTQRYGYYEVRVKLPTAPGLWPAFWLMPERGKDVGEQWQRQDTGNGGMEFDVIEHLTRWGPCRNNIAMHWDGYGEEHKQLGTDRIYMQPDKDGYVTGGLLWLPGQAIYYVNGSETARWESPRISSVPSCLLFTLPQGGWDNSAMDDSKLPDVFTIDYVRIWQRKDLASQADGPKNP